MLCRGPGCLKLSRTFCLKFLWSGQATIEQCFLFFEGNKACVSNTKHKCPQHIKNNGIVKTDMNSTFIEVFSQKCKQCKNVQKVNKTKTFTLQDYQNCSVNVFFLRNIQFSISVNPLVWYLTKDLKSVWHECILHINVLFYCCLIISFKYCPIIQGLSLPSPIL